MPNAVADAGELDQACLTSHLVDHSAALFGPDVRVKLTLQDKGRHRRALRHLRLWTGYRPVSTYAGRKKGEI